MRLFILCICGLASTALWAKAFTFASASGRHELEFELDPYYSAIDYIGSLDEEPIPALVPGQEQGLYEALLARSLSPRYFVLEASFNPLPFSGAMLQTHQGRAYSKLDYGNGNLIHSLTAGFPEPWALSCFWGNVVNFVTADSAHSLTGKGYSGLLLSLGNYHLLRGHFIEEPWAEGEIKLKGSELGRDRRLSWSFRAGGRVHGHRDIRNTFYLSLKRDRADFRLSENLGFWKALVLRNSEVEARIDLTWPRQPRLWEELASVMLLGGKKWPSASGDWAFALGFGVLYQTDRAYKGELGPWARESEWSLLLRPNIVF